MSDERKTPLGVLGSMARMVCPCCGADVGAVTVHEPAMVNVLIDLDDAVESVTRRSDGSYAIVRTHELHAQSCPKWPDDERMWRTVLARELLEGDADTTTKEDDDK